MYPRALIFDLDGTLVDSMSGIVAACRAACQEMGYPEPDESLIRPSIGLSLERFLRAALGSEVDDACVADCADRYRAAFDRIALPATVAFPGVAAELRRWRTDRRRLAVATSKSTHVALRVLAQARLADLFDLVVGGDQVARGKPDPEMAVRALAGLDVARADAALIGDTVHDIQMARAAGVAAYAVTYGAQDRATVAASSPLAIVDRFEDLAAYLG